MKPGKPIVFCATDGSQHPATVIEVVGTGASTFKRCDVLTDAGARVLNVAHRGDAAAGEPCWMLTTETLDAPAAATAEPAAAAHDDEHETQF